MGKAAALTALGGGGAAITAGGYYLTKGGGGTAGQGDQKSATAETQEAQSSPALIDTLDKFKSGSATDKCIKAIFGDSGIALGSLAEDTANFTDNNSFFGTAPTTDGENQSKSCLAINYEKSKGSGSETDKGTFT